MIAREKAQKAKKTLEDLRAAQAKTKQALVLARSKIKNSQANKAVKVAYKSVQIAWDKVIEARTKAQKAQRDLQNHIATVNAIEVRLERAVQDVYMAAALGAFKHIADEAIKTKAQAEPVTQR